MFMGRTQFIAAVAPVALASIQPSTFTAPGAFPTSAFSKYFNSPTATSAQPQPVISDPILHTVFPHALTDPNTIPTNDTADPHPLPPVASSSRIFNLALAQLQSIATNPIFANNTCATCQASLELAKFVSLASPSNGPEFFIQFCNTFKLSSTCNVTYGQFSGIGSVVTQVVANADVGGYDGQALCQNFFGMCPAPPTIALNLDGWFAKQKPNPLPPPKKRSGQRLKVLHLSDFHIDPRYATGAEANCTSGLCCRANNHNNLSPNKILAPAPRYGAYLCDTPISLALAALEAVPALTGTKGTGFAFTVYTGDLVSHDPDNQLGRAYIEYTETILYDLFKRMLGSGPVYPALGIMIAITNAPHSLGGELAQQFSWNYDHVAGLWQHENWIPESAVELARSHYAAYMVRRVDGLRVITLNTDFWYKANYFNYINMTDPDTSGMLRFLTDELQDAEDAGDRVWILGHVLSGWDGTNPLRNPTNLFYQIVDRFSPHVIANIFFGHTHEDQLNIFYANNATVQSADTALAVSWIAPSITPLTNLNSGFRVYEVDSAPTLRLFRPLADTFQCRWRSDVNSFHALDSQTKLGPTYAYEYNTRETYGATITGWGPNDPLNATWWHLVTEAMQANSSLVTTFNTFQGKSSILSLPCTGSVQLQSLLLEECSVL
ncbi:Metallo-dependent phosphatase-like protein [Gymnopilus junonius]|uniref:Metallo-dependent phosphatase-like protein n=1 Tax=Gymnopilus junonius TaxID=109634 RepID=A0A9P5P2F2_GYMJU|nr:Metallo-dependent phosphatase-like protein [Gymnopilus junonius]